MDGVSIDIDGKECYFQMMWLLRETTDSTKSEFRSFETVRTIYFLDGIELTETRANEILAYILIRSL